MAIPPTTTWPSLTAVLKQITHAEVDWMQDRPYDEYTFLYHFPQGPAGGGMEHAYGTAIDVNAERLRERHDCLWPASRRTSSFICGM